MTRRKVLGASPTAVVLADGDRIQARGVIDARGPGDLGLLELGWQKFLGREFRLARRSRRAASDGDGRDRRADRRLSLRLLRCPSPRPGCSSRIPITATGPSSDRAALTARIDDYVGARGWQVDQVVREESGCTARRDGRRFRGILAQRRQQGRQGGHARRAVPSDHRLFPARCGAHRIADRARRATCRARRCTI